VPAEMRNKSEMKKKSKEKN